MDYRTVLQKIAESTLTVEDLNAFIIEALPKSIGTRITRRTLVGHGNRIDKKSGHSRVAPMGSGITARTHPKKKPNGQMGYGLTKQGHDASTRTQRRRSGKGMGGAAGPKKHKVDDLLLMMRNEKLTLEQLYNKLLGKQSDIALDDTKVKQIDGKS